MGRSPGPETAVFGPRPPLTTTVRSLEGKVALVTGAAVRVGRRIALALAADGARVVVHYRSSSAHAESLVHEIRSRGGEAMALPADLAVPEEARTLVRNSARLMGGLDVLVNSAS